MRVEGYKRVLSKNSEYPCGCDENATRSKCEGEGWIIMSGGCAVADL